MYSIPGYSTLAEFAKDKQLPYMTVKNHMIRGVCRWPRKIDDGITNNCAYKCWENMVSRCTNPNSTGYENYGGRGISLHSEFISFRNFISHIGPRPGKEYSIDRIDVNGNYEPGNVRWATYQEQARNKRHECKTTEDIEKHGKKYRFSFEGVRYFFTDKQKALEERSRLYKKRNQDILFSKDKEVQYVGN